MFTNTSTGGTRAETVAANIYNDWTSTSTSATSHVIVGDWQLTDGWTSAPGYATHDCPIYCIEQ